MNDAHLHLIVNHFPLIGVIFGLGILIAGLLLKSKGVQHTAYVLFVISAIFGLLSMRTGEGAEEILEEMGTSGKLIHEHEEMAEKFILVLYGTGIMALIALITSIKNYSKAIIFGYITLALAMATAVLSKNAATSGGEIRHTEIRVNEASSTENTENQEVEKEGKTDDSY